MLTRLLLLATTLVVADGFLIAPKPVTALKDMAVAQEGQKLDIHLQIGQKKDAPMYLQGLQLVLGDKIEKSKVKMPGKHGPHPNLSSGIGGVDVVTEPFFIGMNGRENVLLEDGCWELIWRDGAPAGSLICAFDVPDDYVRNQATLTRGVVYLSFPVWTAEGLIDMQARKVDVMTRGEALLSDRDAELAKMQETDNILMKALHYRNAAEAVERFSLTGYHRFKEEVPDQEDVMPIHGGLLLTTKGTVWTKDKAGGLFFNKHHNLLGSAVVQNAADEE